MSTRKWWREALNAVQRNPELPTNRLSTWWHEVLDLLPALLPAMLAAFSAVAITLLLLNRLENVYVWSLGGLAAGVTGWVVVRTCFRNQVLTMERAWCNALTVLGIVGWGIFNAIYSGQHLITNRDPGTYANAALWLLHHTNLRIPAQHVFGVVSGIAPTSGGLDIDRTSGFIVAQGQHLLPVLLALGGRLLGVSAMFRLNVVCGMLALLAIYGFARLLVRPFWAMIITGVLAASMPFIYFSRDTYTEPLAAAFTFGALCLVVLALRTRRPSLSFVAGLTAGASSLTRIDGYLLLVGLAGLLGVVLITSVPKDRASLLKRFGALAAGATITGLLGWADVRWLSRPYYLTSRPQMLEELAMLGLVVAASAVACWFVWHWSQALYRLDSATRNWRASVAALIVLTITLLLSSRLLWQRSIDPRTGQRSFAELSVLWPGWYIGVPLVILGVIGLAYAATTAMRRHDPALLLGLLVVGLSAFLYCLQPSIAPDQIWAVRRFVPIILPGLAIFGAVIIEQLVSAYYAKVRFGALYVAVVVVALLFAPLTTSRPLLLTRDTAVLAPLQSMCAVLPARAAILWIGTARTQLVQATAGLCNVPAEGYGRLFVGTDTPDRTVLRRAAANARRAHYVPLVGVYASQITLLPGAAGHVTTVASGVMHRLENPIANAPQRILDSDFTILVGRLLPDGTITLLAPANRTK